MSVTDSPSSTSSAGAVTQLTLATVRETGVTQQALADWAAVETTEETRETESVHDCIAVTRRRHSSRLEAADETCRDFGIEPQDLLGLTTVVVVQCTQAIESHESLIDRLFPLLEQVTGGAWKEGLSLFAGYDHDVLICIADTETDRQSALRIVLSELRLLETFRHKLTGQSNGYLTEYRNELLRGVEHLSQLLNRIANAHGERRNPARIREFGHDVVSQYCALSRVHTRVREVEAMLTANLRNLDEAFDRSVIFDDPTAPGHVLLSQRVAWQRMHLAQVATDLRRIEPVMDAARFASEFHQSQMLERLTEAERQSNRQRDEQARQRDSLSFRMTVLGIWLGISQMWLGWVALQSPEERSANTSFVGWCITPTFVVIMVMTYQWVKNRSGSATDSGA